MQEVCRVNKLINYPIGKIPLMSLRSSHIYTLKEDLKKIPLAPSSINKYVNILSNCWNVARKEWGISLPAQSPFDLVTMEKVNDARTRILNKAEYKLLLEKAELAPLTMLTDLIKFAYLTGARDEKRESNQCF